MCPSAGPLALPKGTGRGSPRVHQWELTQGSSWLQAGRQLQRQRQQLQRFQLPLEILVSIPLPVLLGLAFPVPIRVQKIQVRALFFLLESGSASRWLLPSARPFCRKPLGGLAAPFFFLVTRNASLQPFFLPWALPREQGWVRRGLAHLRMLCERLSMPLKGRRGG